MPYPNTDEIKKTLALGELNWDTIFEKVLSDLRMSNNHGGICRITFDFFWNSREVTCHIASNGGWLKKEGDKTTEANGNFQVAATATDTKLALLRALEQIYLG